MADHRFNLLAAGLQQIGQLVNGDDHTRPVALLPIAPFHVRDEFL